VTSKIRRIETANDRSEFAAFMKGEKIYETVITMTDPMTKDTFEVPVVYSPATAFDIATIYADIDKDASTEEQFDYTTQLFQFAIRSPRFVNVPKGTANYEAGEISMQDLMTDQKLMLERAVAPGVGKSGADLEQELKASRRQVGKGSRSKKSSGMDAGAT
jgi:hypothetical protein